MYSFHVLLAIQGERAATLLLLVGEVVRLLLVVEEVEEHHSYSLGVWVAVVNKKNVG